MDDKMLRQNVVDELDFEPSVEAANIGIAVEKGVVSLTGHVSSYAEKLAALDAARRVKGVRAVAEEIEVRYPNGKKTSDDQIAKRVADILAWDTVIPTNAVQVTVHKGWVTLAGQVNWQFQRKAAENDVRRLNGVVGVVNNLSIKPAVQTTEVKRRIEEALRRRAEIESGRIRIDVHDGNRVRLEGKVDNWEERDAVENAAWSVPGVQFVEDHLTVSS